MRLRAGDAIAPRLAPISGVRSSSRSSSSSGSRSGSRFFSISGPSGVKILAGFDQSSVTPATVSLTPCGAGVSTAIAGPAPGGGAVTAPWYLDPPILDLRPSQAGPRRWTGRLLTLALWAGAASLMGAPLSAGLALGALPVLFQARRRRGLPLVAALPPAVPEDLPRQALAEAFGLGETSLFRARHARLSTVHFNAEGSIVTIDCAPLPGPLDRQRSPLRSDHHAHPVG